MYKISVENLVVQENKEVLRNKTKSHNDEGMSKGYRSQLRETPIAKAGTFD